MSPPAGAGPAGGPRLWRPATASGQARADPGGPRQVRRFGLSRVVDLASLAVRRRRGM